MAADIFPDPETAPDQQTRRLWAIRRELRGLIFSAADGTVISRRFHKFFNIGELPETQPEKVDMSIPFVVLEKLDGSMIGTSPPRSPNALFSGFLNENCYFLSFHEFLENVRKR